MLNIEELIYINCPICGRKLLAVWMEKDMNIYGCAHCHIDITIKIDRKYED